MIFCTYGFINTIFGYLFIILAILMQPSCCMVFKEVSKSQLHFNYKTNDTFCCLKFYKNAPINIPPMSCKYFLCIPCIRIKFLGSIMHSYLALVETMYFPRWLHYFTCLLIVMVVCLSNMQ